jgi:putative addiction module killer protein
VIEARQTDFLPLGLQRDSEVHARIAVCICRLPLGNPGDVRPVGSDASEMRIDFGPGYRRSDTVVVLLFGGGKRTEDRDIAPARELAREI